MRPLQMAACVERISRMKSLLWAGSKVSKSLEAMVVTYTQRRKEMSHNISQNNARHCLPFCCVAQ